MVGSRRWRALDVGLPNAPRLLLKPDVSATGYHVQITDLCRVWAEKLCKRDIIRRAWDDGCSIDPSEDDQQFSIFLEKIDSALGGEDGTSMKLLPGVDGSIKLQLSAQLPKGFRTLVWTICLTRQTDEALARTLTVPLLQQADDLKSQVQTLIHELQEKDRVISKITDRLETSGNDLTTVFPGVTNIRTNKKKSQREQLARHVRGLADFDEAEWRRGHDQRSSGNLWPDWGNELGSMPEIDRPEELARLKDEWWKNLDGATTAKSKPVSTTASVSPSATNVNALQQEENMQDDEFQRQATPDYLKERVSARSKGPVEDSVGEKATTPELPDQQPQQQQQQRPDYGGDSTTEDEDDLDSAPMVKPDPKTKAQQSPVTSKSPPSRPTKKLGAIGGRSSRPPDPPVSNLSPKQVPEPVAKPKGKLGALGGKAKATQQPALPRAEDNNVPAAAPRKMGVIGGKRKPSNSEPAALTLQDAGASPKPEPDRSGAPTREPTPPQRETSQERADRKRDQLKRELEQKAKAPAKKKRKF